MALRNIERGGVIGFGAPANILGLLTEFFLQILFHVVQRILADEIFHALGLAIQLAIELVLFRDERVELRRAHFERMKDGAMLANARSRVCFQLSHEDAAQLAKGHRELGPEDFTSLGQYQVYASLFARGAVSSAGSILRADFHRRSRS